MPRSGSRVLGRERLRSQVHVRGRGLRIHMPHQLPQDQQVDTGGGQFRAVGVAQPVRPDPDRAGAMPVGAEDPPQSRLGERSAGVSENLWEG